MKKQKLIMMSILACILFLVSCKKKDEPIDTRQYSTWVVGKDSFSTNKTIIEFYRQISVFSTEDRVNGFGFIFNCGRLFLNDSFTFSNVDISNPKIVYGGVIYHDTNYVVLHNYAASLVGSEVNGKFRFVLRKAWFVNVFRPDDSVLISGVFNEP